MTSLSTKITDSRARIIRHHMPLIKLPTKSLITFSLHPHLIRNNANNKRRRIINQSDNNRKRYNNRMRYNNRSTKSGNSTPQQNPPESPPESQQQQNPPESRRKSDSTNSTQLPNSQMFSQHPSLLRYHLYVILIMRLILLMRKYTEQ
jgi:hypothetical protein